MNLECVRSFMHVVETGSFSLAAARLSVMQSTISGRIRSLENELGQTLFSRGRGGAELTRAGHEFRQHAEIIIRSWEQARHRVALPAGYRGVFRLGGPVGLQDRLDVRWVLWMKEHAPGIALHLDAGYSDLLTDRLVAGTLDAAVMYLPRQRSSLNIEELRKEDLILVAHAAQKEHWSSNYVAVDWGHEFSASFSSSFPDLAAPTLTVGLGTLGLQYVMTLQGAAYLPLSLVHPLIVEGKLSEVAGAPVFRRPVYLVHPTESREPELLALALAGLRHVAASTEERWTSR
jgi:DNA-binding transcriptional LysR family regulator